MGAASPLRIDIKGPLTDAERTALLSRIRFAPDETPPEEPPDWLYDMLPTEIDITPDLVPDALAYVVIEHKDPDGPYHEMLCLPLRSEGGEFRFVPVSPAECWRTVYAHFDHWHPGSRCSGWWSDTAGVAAPGIFAVWRLKDEEGNFLELEPIDDQDPEAVADRIAGFVDDFEVYECEKVLLAAYVHGVIGELLQGVEIGIDLFTDENPGYCMTPRFDLPPEILAALRRHEITAVGRALATPGSPEHAQYVRRLGEDAGCVGEELVGRLREALEGGGGRRGTGGDPGPLTVVAA